MRNGDHRIQTLGQAHLEAVQPVSGVGSTRGEASLLCPGVTPGGGCTQEMPEAL